MFVFFSTNQKKGLLPMLRITWSLAKTVISQDKQLTPEIEVYKDKRHERKAKKRKLRKVHI